MAAITFVDADGVEHTVEGEVGANLMTVAVNHDIPGIDGECGGDMACGTCHVYVDETSVTSMPPCGAEEAEMIEVLVDGLKPTSRLGCQLAVTADLGGMRVVVA